MYLTLPLFPPPHYLLLLPPSILPPPKLGGPCLPASQPSGWCYPTGRCAYLPSVTCYRQSIKTSSSSSSLLPPSPLLPLRYRLRYAHRDRERVTHTRTDTQTHTHTHTHTHHTCIQASSQAIRREQSIPQIGQGSTHVAHHVMLKQQSFKRGGRGRSQIVETRQGSKIDRREGGGGERRARLGKGVRGKRRVFSKTVSMSSY